MKSPELPLREILDAVDIAVTIVIAYRRYANRVRRAMDDGWQMGRGRPVVRRSPVDHLRP